MRTFSASVCLFMAAAVVVGGCAPSDDFLYGLRFECDDEHPCAAGFTCSPDGLCAEQGSVGEVCNGLDDNDNGVVDDGLGPEACELDQGVCAGATKPAELCQGVDGWAACRTLDYQAHNAVYEETEASCDGYDNDCDGVTDNLSASPTEPQEGVCLGAIMVCDAESLTLTPSYESDPQWEATESACDGLDNDCDGVTDEMRWDSGDDCGSCDFACPSTNPDCAAGVCRDAAAALCGYILGPNDSLPAAEMCNVPAGSYAVGETPSDVSLEDAVLIDRFEVTNARYAAFLEDQDGAEDLLPVCDPTSARDWTSASPDFLTELSEHPVVCVTRAQAEAFCVWAGKRLPSAVEWEAAARGSGDGDFPWGSDAAVGRANCMNELCHDVYPTDTCAVVDGSHTQCADTAPIFDPAGEPTLPDGASPLGPLHMAGNVAEWVAGSGETGVIRGGSWYDDLDGVRVWSERSVASDYAKTTTGFRCAADWPAPLRASPQNRSASQASATHPRFQRWAAMPVPTSTGTCDPPWLRGGSARRLGLRSVGKLLN